MNDKNMVLHYNSYKEVTTPRQTLAIGRTDEAGLVMDLNGQVQFTEADEKDYHAGLVRPAMGAVSDAKSVLILGAGDGLALRDVLAYPVQDVTLVEYDPVVVAVSRLGPVARLNKNSFSDPRATTVIDDAREFLKRNKKLWDVIIVDFPDPSEGHSPDFYGRKTIEMIMRSVQPSGAVSFHASADPMNALRVVEEVKRLARHVKLVHRKFRVLGDTYFVLALGSRL